MRTLEQLIADLRQWTYPPELRIAAPEGEGVVPLVLEATSRARAAAQAAEEAAKEAATAPGAALPKTLAIELANQCFNLGRNLAQMEGDEALAPRRQRLGRVLDRMNRILEEHGVRWVDLTGQRYEEGRLDFQSLGPPQEVAGVTEPIIRQTECPAVFIQDKLVQTARGIVARPPAPTQGKDT